MSGPFAFSCPAEAVAGVGRALGPGGWLAVDQHRIDLFARATGDEQWIHVDPERAARGPFGRTIAHGYLTLSLVNLFLPELIVARGARMAINYGADRLRFPAPVPVGARIRAAGTLVKAAPVGPDGVQTTCRIAVEIAGAEKPGCVADIISRFHF